MRPAAWAASEAVCERSRKRCMIALSSITEKVRPRRFTPVGTFASVASSCRIRAGSTFSSRYWRTLRRPRTKRAMTSSAGKVRADSA